MKGDKSGRHSKNHGSLQAVYIFLAASPLMTAPPSNLTRLYYNGSAAKSHLTTRQYRQLRRLSKLRTEFFSIDLWPKREALGP